MEPNHLKSPAPDDPQLEAWLGANSSLPPLPDNGFSARVLTALPPPKRRLSPRLLACMSGAVVGLALAAGPALMGGNPFERLPALDAALLRMFEELTSPSMGIAFAVTAGSLAYVFWPDLRRRPRRRRPSVSAP